MRGEAAKGTIIEAGGIMKVCGVIGGLGPDTTAKFYTEFVQRADEFGAANRPGIMLWSVPIEYSMERDSIVHGKGVEKMLPLLLDGARRLEAAGAQFLVMPCNTLHLYIGEIREAVRIPVLSIVEETAARLQEAGVSVAGILGTRMTIESGLYQEALAASGIDTVCPVVAVMEVLGEIIHRLVMGRSNEEDRRLFGEFIDYFTETGASHILLACTDLQLLCNGCNNLQLVDTFDVLLNAALRTVFEGCLNP